MDGRIHGTLRHGRDRPLLYGRGVQKPLRNLHQQSVAAGSLHLSVRAGYPLRDRARRAEGHRAFGQNPDAAALRHPDYPVGPLAADAGRRSGTEIPFRSGFLESDAHDGARRAGTGVLLALDRHRDDGHLRLLFQARHQPAPYGAQRHDPRHAGSRSGRRGDLPGGIQRGHRAFVGSVAGVHHPAEHLQRHAPEHGLVVGILPAAGRGGAHLDDLAARSGDGLPA